jgi:hypothetical protein
MMLVSLLSSPVFFFPVLLRGSFSGSAGNFRQDGAQLVS